MTRKGQSTLEYAILVAVVAAAAIGMQVYVKRGVQGRLRQSADSVGDQYAPGQTSSSYTTSFTTLQPRLEEAFEIGKTSTAFIDEKTTRTEVAPEKVEEVISKTTPLF